MLSARTIRMQCAALASVWAGIGFGLAASGDGSAIFVSTAIQAAMLAAVAYFVAWRACKLPKDPSAAIGE